MNKPVHLGRSVLEISKILIHEFCYDYVKPKYVEKINLCYMDNECFIVYIKTDDVYKLDLKMLKLDLIFQIMN